MSSLAGLVVDVDDTLYLERDYVRSGLRHLDDWCRQELGVGGVGECAWRLFEGGRRRTIVTDALRLLEVEVTPGLTERVVSEYRAHRPRITLLPDARWLLTHVGEVVPIAVVTDGPAESQRAKVAALGLPRWASPIVVTAELGSSKPDPEMFRTAVRNWNIPAHDIVYVADNPAKDFTGPRELGWRAVRVRREGSLHELLATPDWVIEVRNLQNRIIRALFNITATADGDLV